MIEIIMVFVVLVVIFLALFWLKKIFFIFGFFFKLFLLVLLVGVVFSFVFGYMVVKDANDFKNNFGNSTSVFIMKDTVNGTETFMTGVKINLDTKDYEQLSKEELAKAEQLYKDDDMELLGDEYYKAFIIDFKMYDDVQPYNMSGISDHNINLSKEEAREILLSKNAKRDLAKIVSKKTGVNEDKIYSELKADDDEIKKYIFSYYLTAVLDSSNIGEFLNQIKKDNIKIYSNTALFKAIKLMPNAIIEKLA